MIDIDPTTQLILNVGNVIHDDVCLALSRVNFKELEDAPHSDRVDAAAVKIIAMIEQDVARRLLSDEGIRGVFSGDPVLGPYKPTGGDIAATRRSMAVALTAIGIDVEPQP